MTIEVARSLGRNGASREPRDPLSPLVTSLVELCAELEAGHLSAKARANARKLSNFFKDAHDHAQGLVARIPRRASADAPKAAIGLLREDR